MRDRPCATYVRTYIYVYVYIYICLLFNEIIKTQKDDKNDTTKTHNKLKFIYYNI